MRNCILIILLAVASFSCQDFPKDPGNTLEEVTGATLLVGYSENPPWVVDSGGEPTGIEPDLVRAFAKSVNADIVWKKDAEQDLFEGLEKNEIHLAIAGITNSNLWKKKVAFTRPYYKKGKEKHVLAAIRGENAFIVKLEEFLYAREQEINERLTHGTDK